LISTARILFFITFSFALHFLILSFDFRLLSEPIKIQMIGIGYVSRSLDSFCSASESIVTKSEQVNEFSHRNQLNIKTNLEQSYRNKLLKIRPEEIKSVVSICKSKQISTIPKSMKISVTEPLPEKSLNQLELVKSDTIDVEKPEQQALVEPALPGLLMETITQPPAPPVVHLKLLVKEELFAAGIDDQAERRIINYEQTGVSKLQKDNNNIAGFQEALPRYDSNPPPEYPEVARRRGWQGIVQFEVLVLKNGRVGGLKMLVSTGYRSLDNAARKAIKHWKFQPATSFGMPIASRVIVPVDFVIAVNH
jgi:TonB family protein